MGFNTDKNVYTVIFAAVMVVVVGSLLAFMASGLRSKIDENERYEKQQNILYAMGVNENEGEGDVVFIPTEEVEDAFSKFITKQIILDKDGGTTEDTTAYLLNVKKQIPAAKKGKDVKLPVFIGEKDGETFHILPMYGKGLWDAIWGYMSVDETMTVQGVYFDHKGETAGLGANIKLRFFMDDFEGESLLANGRYDGIIISKTNNDPLNKDKDDNEIDALAGATITGNGVSDMIKETLKLYRPYLETIRTN